MLYYLNEAELYNRALAILTCQLACAVDPIRQSTAVAAMRVRIMDFLTEGEIAPCDQESR